MTIISLSDLRAFRTCRRKWWYSSPLGCNKQAPRTNKHLITGGLVHDSLARHYAPSTGALAFYELEAERTLREMPPTFRQGVAEELEKGGKALTHYLEWAQVHDTFKVTGVEVTFVVPLKGLEDVVYAGRADGVAKEKGALWLLEHKTCSSFPDFDMLFLDEQCIAYQWAYRETFGEFPKGTIYTFIRKAAPAPPRVLKNGTISRAEKALAATSLSLYKEALDDAGLQEQDYQKELDLLRSREDPFVRRVHISRPEDAADRFEKTLYSIIGEMLDPDLPIYPNPNWFGCKYCAFKDVCALENNGKNPMPLLDHAFEERKERYEV